MAKNRAEKLEELRLKESQIKAQIQQLKQKDQAEERKKDTRRKILIGGAVMAKIKRGEWNYQQLIDLLESELKNDRDRALFDEMNLKAVDARK
ncbi:hypothetical protein [Pantoea sp. Taur]|uniref:hypothetical protein n=1 Tax=Pantoea sp. Taur TaxID=2576757 RepID=UPI0013561B89|nr:hypothetical protein [Pantoea sp. Taur]MXP61679.1 hypothetical protein [Pantoea sp. Taur]